MYLHLLSADCDIPPRIHSCESTIIDRIGILKKPRELLHGVFGIIPGCQLN